MHESGRTNERNIKIWRPGFGCCGCLCKKNIPPPIPTIPETKPIIDPIKIDIIFGILFNLIISLLKDLLSINKNIPAITRTINKIISKNSFDIGIEAPKNANGIEPAKYGTNNLRLR